MEFRGIADLNQIISANLHRIPPNVELVVGVPRSGMLAGSMIALHLNLPLVDLDGYLAGRVFGYGKTREPNRSRDDRERRRVVVVDDSLSKGREFQRIKRRIEQSVVTDEIYYAVIYCNPAHATMPDVVFKEMHPPRLYEWNLLHSSQTRRVCVLLEGVLAEPRDRAEGGAAFDGMKPRVIPGGTIGWVLSERGQADREAAAAWLRRHNIAYRELRMLDIQAERGSWVRVQRVLAKARVYSRTRAELLVDGSRRDAKLVARLVGRRVWCPNTCELFDPSGPLASGKMVFKVYERCRKLFSFGAGRSSDAAGRDQFRAGQS